MPPVRLPKAHRVVFRLAQDRGVTIYWYRRRGQTPAMISFTGPTMADALEAERTGADDIIAAYGATRPAPPVTQLKDLITRYKMAPDGWKRVADSTKATWSPWLDKISAEFGDMPIGAIGAKGVRSAIIEWRDSFAETPRAADTAMQVFTRVLNWAVHRELIDKNPAAGIEQIYKANRADIIVEPAELAEILKHLGKPGQLAVRLAAATGLRRGDLIDLRWNEVGDFHIERAANKSTTGKRILVPLIADAREVIADLRKLNKASDVPTTHVLRSSRGPWQKDGLNSTWSKAKKKAKVDKHFNDLRGTACTRFYTTIDRVTDEEMADIMAWEPERCRAIRKRYVDPARITAGIVARIEKSEKAK